MGRSKRNSTRYVLRVFSMSCFIASSVHRSVNRIFRVMSKESGILLTASLPRMSVGTRVHDRSHSFLRRRLALHSGHPSNSRIEHKIFIQLQNSIRSLPSLYRMGHLSLSNQFGSQTTLLMRHQLETIAAVGTDAYTTVYSRTFVISKCMVNTSTIYFLVAARIIST
jgi:hypothetical protein